MLKPPPPPPPDTWGKIMRIAAAVFALAAPWRSPRGPISLCAAAITGLVFVLRPTLYNPVQRSLPASAEGCAVVTGWAMILFALVIGLLLHAW